MWKYKLQTIKSCYRTKPSPSSQTDVASDGKKGGFLSSSLLASFPSSLLASSSEKNWDARERREGNVNAIKGIGMYPMNVCTKCHGSPSICSCWHNSVGTKSGGPPDKQTNNAFPSTTLVCKTTLYLFITSRWCVSACVCHTQIRVCGSWTQGWMEVIVYLFKGAGILAECINQEAPWGLM